MEASKITPEHISNSFRECARNSLTMRSKPVLCRILYSADDILLIFEVDPVFGLLSLTPGGYTTKQIQTISLHRV